MKLGIDIDGTIKYTHRAAIEIYNEELNMNVAEEEVTTYFLDVISDKDASKSWQNSSESLQQLEKEGHEIFFITARPGFKKVRKITEEWLVKYNFPLNKNNLFMSSQNKSKIALSNQIDLFFEDDPFHINNLIKNGISTVVVDRPYNRILPNDIPRINDWFEGIDYIHTYNKKINGY